ncbi:hypothetical protein [Streptomyces lomondensis]|uniref:Uncharacterized protein n=1 Tax=Streptomyces lomondensis TaxID=68229 RepID=A0ABQ2XI80_9ACTN|nr:hypothetical protein [Streptomyces lomondensis]MCF0079576.1 hypothetical protein [Streptomyces lomondensis]GGX18969.1 hypothetical protein GCM10010383_56230 [Streptomyces lomondensis]
MGNWVVIAEYYSDVYRTEFICRGLETKDQALKELRAALHTYVPSKNIIEKRRHVYRFADQESYLVVIKGKLTEWECSLRIAELVSDSTDPTVAKRAQTGDGAAEVAEGPQDGIPPGY